MKQDIRILIDVFIGKIVSEFINFALITIGYFQFDQKHPFKENGSLKGCVGNTKMVISASPSVLVFLLPQVLIWPINSKFIYNLVIVLIKSDV